MASRDKEVEPLSACSPPGHGLGTPDTIGDDELPQDVGVVAIGEPAVDIASGAEHTCVVTVGGSVVCWGSNGNNEGVLGYGVPGDIGDDDVPQDFGPVPL